MLCAGYAVLKYTFIELLTILINFDRSVFTLKYQTEALLY